MVNFPKTWPNLSAGELDVSLAAREDLQFYDKGLKSARNILCLPTGGFTDRGGFRHVEHVRGQLVEVDISAATITGGGAGGDPPETPDPGDDPPWVHVPGGVIP